MRVKQGENFKLLVNAVKKNEVKEVGRLIDSGEYEVNTEDSDGNSLLALASGHSTENFEMLDFLIGRNANINAQNRRGESVLTYACRKNGSPFIIKYLLEHKADIEQTDRDGMTPLMMTVREEKSETARILISARANLEAATKKIGNTALLLACDKKNYEMVSLLIQAGANVNHKQHSGGQYTALMITAEKRQNSVVSILKLLLQAGSDKTIQDKKGKKAEDVRRDKFNIAFYIFLGLILATLVSIGVYLITLPDEVSVVVVLFTVFSAFALIGVGFCAYNHCLRGIECGYDWLRINSLSQELNPIWSFKPKRSDQILEEYAKKITRAIQITLETKENRINLSIPETQETQNFIDDQSRKYQEAIIAALLDWDLFNDFTDDTNSITSKNQADCTEKLTEKLLKLFYAQPLKFRSVEEITSHVKNILVEWSKGIMHQQSSDIPALLTKRKLLWQQETRDIKSLEMKNYSASKETKQEIMPVDITHSVDERKIFIPQDPPHTRLLAETIETKAFNLNPNSHPNTFPVIANLPASLPGSVSVALHADIKRQKFSEDLAALAEIKDRKVLQQKFSQLENRAIEFQSSDFYIQRGEFYFAAAEVESNDLRLGVLYGKALQDFQLAITHDPFVEGIPEKIQKIRDGQKKLDERANPRLFQPPPLTNETPLSDQEREAVEKMKAEMRKNMSMNMNREA